jgi:hypothetical protein
MIQFQTGNAEHERRLRRHVRAYETQIERGIFWRIALVVVGFAFAAALYFVLNPS